MSGLIFWSLLTQSTWRTSLRVKRWGNFHRRFTKQHSWMQWSAAQRMRHPSRFHFIHTRTNAPWQAHLSAEHSCETSFWWQLVSARNETITYNPLEGMSNRPNQVASGVYDEFVFGTVHIYSTTSFVAMRSGKTVKDLRHTSRSSREYVLYEFRNNQHAVSTEYSSAQRNAHTKTIAFWLPVTPCSRFTLTVAQTFLSSARIVPSLRRWSVDAPKSACSSQTSPSRVLDHATVP